MFDLEVFIPIVMFFAVAYIVKVVSDNRVRRMAVEKGIAKEDLKNLFYNGRAGNVSSSLKWGIVLIAVGAALFISQLIPAENIEAVTLGLIFVFAGIGLVISYVLDSRSAAKKEM